MIFRIKHYWWLALLVTLVCSGLSLSMGGWPRMVGEEWSLTWQIAFGVGGAGAALLVNGLVHEILRRSLGQGYMRAFQRYAGEILDGMAWPAYLTGGLMAALAEEPFFRGVVLGRFDDARLGVGAAAILFALCHWMRLSYLGFWFWAIWEGVLFGLLLVATGSLLVPMIAHGLHDVTAYPVLRALLGRGENTASA